MTRGSRLVVRARPVRARADDGEVGPLVPGVEHALHELAVHVGFGAAAERPGAHLVHDGVDGTGSRAQRVDLGRVLHHAQRRRDLARLPERRCAAGRAGARAGSAPTCGRRWRRSPARRRARRRCRWGRRSRPRPRSRTRPGSSRTRSGFEARHDEGGVAVAREHEHREPLGLERLVAREPGQVGADREQQHVDAELVHAAPHPRHAVRRHYESVALRPGRPSMLTAFFSPRYSTRPSGPRRSAHVVSWSRSPS